VPELSDPRHKKLVFYCVGCRAFRITYEPEKDKLFTMLLDGIDLNNILPSYIQKRLNEKSVDGIPLSASRRDMVQRAPSQAGEIPG
jgi:hypothetical protein